MLAVGRCRLIYALDVARSVDLRSACATLSAARETRFHHKSNLLNGGVAAPLRLSWPARAAAEDLARHGFDADVEVAIYDFGALAVTFVGRVEGTLADLVEQSSALYANLVLQSAAEVIARDVLTGLGHAAERPRISALVEDYIVFELEPPRERGEEQLEATIQRSRDTLARVLRGEREQLSDQEVENALANRIAYGRSDAALVDWLSAVLIGEATEDERLVLELATVELLELRILDSQLDVQTEAAYTELARPRPRFSGWGTRRAELERIAHVEAEDALLHEGIDNALKLFGDDYLARLYRVAAARFHFDDFDAAIQRKLTVIARIYERLAEQSARRRSEVLEWIIIALFALDILLYFTPLR